jgi:hypothetical protein
VGDFSENRVNEKLEWKSPSFRELVERAYQHAPRRTDSELVYMGYWDIAAQLRIDHATGKL